MLRAETRREYIKNAEKKEMKMSRTKTVLGLIHTNALFGSAERLKRDSAVNERKKRIIPSQAYVLARMNFRAVLPDEDVSGAHLLSAELFHAQTLSLTVSSVARASYPFFMSLLWVSLIRFHRKDAKYAEIFNQDIV